MFPLVCAPCVSAHNSHAPAAPQMHSSFIESPPVTKRQRTSSPRPRTAANTRGASARATNARATSGHATSAHATNNSHNQTLLSRRGFLYGAAGIGAAAVLGGGGYAAYTMLSSQEEEEEISILEVPEDAVVTLGDTDALTDEEREKIATLSGSYDLPYGTLLWCSCSEVAACLQPTEDTASPLTSAGILFLGSGQYVTLLEEAVGQASGYDIYDVRATSEGIIWTEANILDGIWRIYAAPLSEGVMGDAALVDEGDSEWETPSLAAVGTWGFWQVLPDLNGSSTSEDSLLKRVSFTASSLAKGTDAAEIVYSSTGRMSSPPYATDDAIVITPRTNTSSVHYQLTLLDAKTTDVLDTLVLPTSMQPLEAGYGDTGFSFMFDVIYSYGDGIANLGTYTPVELPKNSDYSSVSWYRFTRTPTAPPTWCNGWFVVKSSYAVVGVDISTLTYFTLPLESGCDNYGDYLASTGSRSSFVTFTNINDTDVEGVVTKVCRVRVWTLAAPA